MLWYLVQTAYQRYERWELKKQLNKLGITSVPSEDLADIAENIAKPVIEDYRRTVDRETILLLTHIAYGFVGRSDCEESIAHVVETMQHKDAEEILAALMIRWQERYPEFLPQNT